MAKGSVWISPNENKVITPKSPIDNAHPNPIQKDTTGKILGNIIILNRLNPVILKLSDNFPTSDETLFIAGNKARKIKGNDIVAFIKITKIGVNISRFINGLRIKKIPVPITIGEVAKINMLKISTYLEKKAEYIKKFAIDKAIQTPKIPENNAIINEFKAAKYILGGKINNPQKPLKKRKKIGNIKKNIVSNIQNQSNKFFFKFK